MDYEEIELTVTAACLLDTSFSRKIPDDLPLRDSFSQMVDIAKKVQDIKAITRMTLLSKIMDDKLPIQKYEVDAVYGKTQELVLLDPKSFNNEVQNAVHLLKEKQAKMDLSLEFNYALGLVDKGRLNDAVTHAKQLHYKTRPPLLPIEDLMLDAVQITNAFKTNIKQIDEIQGGLLKSNIMALIGDSGIQKTRFSLWFCLQILMANPNFTCLYFEKEMSAKDVASYLTQNLVKISMDDIIKISLDKDAEARRKLSREIREAMAEDNPRVDAIKRIKIVPNNMFHSAKDIYEYLDVEKPDIWCLDYLTLIDDRKGKTENKNDGITRTMEIIKEATLATESFGIVISQLNKDTIEKRWNKIPITEDMPYGNILKQFSAYIYALFSPDKYPESQYLKYEGVEMRPSDYYCILRKGRHSKFANDLYFRSSSLNLEFKEILETEKATEEEWSRMNKWIRGYQLPRRMT